MINNYLVILEESLEKKSAILDRIHKISEKQSDFLKGEELDWEQYDSFVDEKSPLIEELEQLDEGFDTLYQRIAEELKKDRAQYAVQIAILQDLIREIMEKSMSLQALESRNKEAVEQHFRRERVKIGTGRKAAKAAYNYYRSASGVDAAPPQFVDKKK